MEDFSAAGVVTQELEQEACNAVEEQVGSNHLAVKFLSGQQPGQKEEICQFHRRFEELSWFQWDSERRSHPGVGQRVLECHSPDGVGLFAVAAASGKAPYPPNGMSQGQSGREGVAG